MVCAFWFYVKAERSVEATASHRYNGVMAAEKMRHTSESLTKIVRNYILTGDDVHKKWYLELDDVRQGKINEPANQYVWDLRLYGENRPLAAVSTMSLHAYLESVAKEDDYGSFLLDAWSHTKVLSRMEREALRLYDMGNAENKQKARDLLFSNAYNDAKLDVLRPLMSFRSASNARSLLATEKAKRWVVSTRVTFLLLGLLALLLAWRTYQSMRHIHGASVKELQDQIERLGQGDFGSAEINPDFGAVDPNSLMSSLNQTRARLQELDAARQNAEYALSDKNRDLALNNLVLQDLTVGLPLGQLLDKLLRAIEDDHPGMQCAVLLVDKKGVQLHHASSPSLGEQWAITTAEVPIGPSVGSCGTAAYRKERVIVEDVLGSPLWEKFKDFIAGFKKGSNDARAYNEASGKELDATFNFSKYAIDGQLPPALRSENKDAPAVFRCGRTGSAEERFAVIAPAQPLCKAHDASGTCTKTLSWRDFLSEDLAPLSTADDVAIQRPDEFAKGEEAAKNTALDNMRILSELYVGMGTYRALEACKTGAAPK